MNSVELFIGAGGLALGVSNAGFHNVAAIERNTNACASISANHDRGVKHVADWKLHNVDIRDFDYRTIESSVDLISGGPPCQPFSLGGKHRAHKDHRDMFPEAVRAVRELQPRAFMFENVRGLVRRSFAKYFEYIILQLTYPEVAIRGSESWEDHQARLERHHTSGRANGLHYRVVFQVLDAANFGTPQRRERVFIVGFRNDLNMSWSFPRPTHSRGALLKAQWATGEYWERHRVTKKDRPPRPAEWSSGVLNMDCFGDPWLTVRDAIHDLPDPELNPQKAARFLNHKFNPGARSYPGHTGSELDSPAKTIKAGDHGVPGGENMVALPNGRLRYFTVRETARLQDFPDEYLFQGSWSEAMRQIGNAVPVNLAFAVAGSIVSHLEQHDGRSARACG